jgi:hypothetical protein
MADITKFTITAYQRQPGYWRAAISPVPQAGNVVRGKTVLSLVTPEDSLSEQGAIIAARLVVTGL